MKSIYVAGPMTGRYKFNFPAFDEASEFLRTEGWDVISPADLDREVGINVDEYPKDFDYSVLNHNLVLEDLIIKDLTHVVQCDAIYMLKGWENSKGATAEHATAIWGDKEIFYE